MLSNIMAAIGEITGDMNNIERKIVADSVAFTLDIVAASSSKPKVAKPICLRVALYSCMHLKTL